MPTINASELMEMRNRNLAGVFRSYEGFLQGNDFVYSLPNFKLNEGDTIVLIAPSFNLETTRISIDNGITFYSLLSYNNQNELVVVDSERILPHEPMFLRFSKASILFPQNSFVSLFTLPPIVQTVG